MPARIGFEDDRPGHLLDPRRAQGHESSTITERCYVHLFDRQRTDEVVRGAEDASRSRTPAVSRVRVLKPLSRTTSKPSSGQAPLKRAALFNGDLWCASS